MYDVSPWAGLVGAPISERRAEVIPSFAREPTPVCLEADAQICAPSVEMLATNHMDIRYDREERARAILRGSRLFLVDPHSDGSDVSVALTAASASVSHLSSIEATVTAISTSTHVDAVVVDASVQDRSAFRELRRVDPTLASFVLGGGPKSAFRLRGALAGLGGAPILDRPAARFEVLEFAARAVEQTGRLRSGARTGDARELTLVPVAPKGEKPYPDAWSCELLRSRICCWSDEVGLSERETEVMRGVVRRLKNREIAAQLDLSIHAVKKYLRELLQKLELESRHEVAWLLDRTPVKERRLRSVGR